MSKEIIKEEIIRTLESILEQTETIDAYDGQIPQIELDIIQDNIRHLYQNFIYLDKINQGEEMAPQVEQEDVETSEEKKDKPVPEDETNFSEKEKQEHISQEKPVAETEEELQDEEQEEEKQQEQEPKEPEQADKSPEAVEQEHQEEEVEKDQQTEDKEKEEKAEPEQDQADDVEKEQQVEEKEAESIEQEPEKEEIEVDNKQEEMPETDSENNVDEEAEAEEEIAPEKPAKMSRAERREEKKKQVAQKKEAKKQQSGATSTADDLFSQKKPEPKSSTLADKLQGSGASSLYDRIGAGNSSGSLSDRLKKKPVKDIKTAIGINEKFLFINELFKGNMHDYNDAIKRLNRAGDLEKAIAVFDEMKEKYNWDNEGQSTLQLLDFVERRYM